MREKLSNVDKIQKAGRYGDGGGLYLLVKKDGRKTWVFRWRDRVTGKLRDKGLGPFGKRDITLSMARDLAAECRQQVRDGLDPIEEGRRARLQAIQDRENLLTFDQCKDRYIEAHRAGWRNKKHAAQWTSTLNTYAEPILNQPVREIDTPQVLKCIEPIWTSKTETATRVRQRIEAVLDWATVRKYRSGDNPARWKGHLDQLLPKPNKLKNVTHRAALPYREVGAFMAKIRAKDSQAAQAIELQILTAARPGEVTAARWDEIDLKEKLWTIPAERTKAHKEHTIPLSPQAVKLLKRIPRVNDFVFPGASLKKPMTTASGMKLIKETQEGITAHGFRSTFRDWAAEQTAFAREVIEHALAHQLKDKAEAAYFRSDLLEKRAKLMNEWAQFCDRQESDADNVTPIRSAS